jgi:hypothetical protein
MIKILQMHLGLYFVQDLNEYLMMMLIILLFLFLDVLFHSLIDFDNKYFQKELLNHHNH